MDAKSLFRELSADSQLRVVKNWFQCGTIEIDDPKLTEEIITGWIPWLDGRSMSNELRDKYLMEKIAPVLNAVDNVYYSPIGDILPSS